MKHLSRLVLALVLFASITLSALAQMSEREFERIDQGKITKNQAQHFALKKFPRATIKKCELHPAKSILSGPWNW